MQVVGQFLNVVLKDFTLASPRLPTHLYLQPLYYSSATSQMDFICLVLGVFNRVPQSYQVMRCHAATTSEELNMFLKRVETHHMDYILLEINKLPFKLQEVSFYVVIVL